MIQPAARLCWLPTQAHQINLITHFLLAKIEDFVLRVPQTNLCCVETFVLYGKSDEAHTTPCARTLFCIIKSSNVVPCYSCKQFIYHGLVLTKYYVLT